MDVPTSDALADILRGRLEKRRGEQSHVFPGAKPGKPLSNVAFPMTLRRLGARGFTVHGFRSSFRDWAADHGVDFDVAEACLAHKVGNAVTRAFLRSTMVARRRKVVADWAAFVAGDSASGTVVQFIDKGAVIRTISARRRRHRRHHAGGSVDVEPENDEKGERCVSLEPHVVNKLRAPRGKAGEKGATRALRRRPADCGFTRTAFKDG
jgi:hypothetical protein